MKHRSYKGKLLYLTDGQGEMGREQEQHNFFYWFICQTKTKELMSKIFNIITHYETP